MASSKQSQAVPPPAPSPSPAQPPIPLVAVKRRERLICSVCFEVFRQPKLLPCHHSLCLHCLRQLIAHTTANTLACPQCRQKVVVPAGGADAFQTNFYILPEDLEAAQHAGGSGASENVTNGDIEVRMDGDGDGGVSFISDGNTASVTPDTTSDWVIALAVASNDIDGRNGSGSERSGDRESRRSERVEQTRVRARREEEQRASLFRRKMQRSCNLIVHMIFVVLVLLFTWWLISTISNDIPFPLWNSGDEGEDEKKEGT